jgi:hypothetical protein
LAQFPHLTRARGRVNFVSFFLVSDCQHARLAGPLFVPFAAVLYFSPVTPRPARRQSHPYAIYSSSPPLYSPPPPAPISICVQTWRSKPERTEVSYSFSLPWQQQVHLCASLSLSPQQVRSPRSIHAQSISGFFLLDFGACLVLSQNRPHTEYAARLACGEQKMRRTFGENSGEKNTTHLSLPVRHAAGRRKFGHQSNGSEC